MAKKVETHRAIVVPDTHAPLVEEAALNCILKATQIVKPDRAVLLGDVGEWDSVSSWKYKKKKRPRLEDHIKFVDDDAEDVNRLLDRFDNVFSKAGVKEKYLCEGNHEVWLDNFVEEHPYLPQYYPAELMDLEARGYEYIKYGDYLKLGELFMYHGGHYNGKYHCFNHVHKLGVNVMYAHYHDVSRESVASLRGVHAAWCIGSLKKHDNESNQWLRGQKVNWSHAFAIVDWYNGSFNVTVVDITEGKCMVWGELIDGNKK